MDQGRLQQAFLAHLHILQSVLTIGMFAGETLWKASKETLMARYGTLSIESALVDLCQCAVNNTNKRTKRVNRIKMIAEIYQRFRYQFSAETLAMIEIVKQLPIQEDEEKSPAEKLAQLRRELNKPENSTDEKLYFETVEYVSPISKQLHGMCTKSINKDGDVYNMMTKIAIIAFTRVLQDNTNYTFHKCASELLSGAQLIFKGGVALGKYLFEKKQFWRHLSEDQQKEIQSSFILGGDNDTSIYFANMKQVTKTFGSAIVSTTIADIAARMQETLWETCEEFKMTDLLMQHSVATTQEPVQFADCDFTLSIREAKGFQLKEVDSYEQDKFEMVHRGDLNEDFEWVEKPTVLCLSPYVDHTPSQVFTTQSKVEFNVGEQCVKFELVRAKLGFSATYHDMTVNTYSELLDISLEYPGSAVLFPKKWQAITL